LLTAHPAPTFSQPGATLAGCLNSARS